MFEIFLLFFFLSFCVQRREEESRNLFLGLLDELFVYRES